MGLQSFVKAVRARALPVAVTTVIVTLAAVGISLLQAPTYLGTAEVLLTQQDTGATLLGSRQIQLSDAGFAREVQTQVEAMRSRDLLAQAIHTIGVGTTPTELSQRLNVSADGLTNIVTIDVTDSSAARAARTANAIAEAYVAWSQDRQRASIRAAADDVARRLTSAQQQIVAIQAVIKSGDTSGAKQLELEAAKRLYATLADQLEQLKLNEQLAAGTGSLFAAAVVNPLPISPNPVRNGALGLALGLVLGLGMTFVSRTLNDAVKSTEEAEELYDAPVLCSIPVEKHAKNNAATLTVLERPNSSGAEAYRVLRNNLGFINFEQGIRTLLVTSAAPNEGKSTVAANLAAVLSTAGKKVILVDCDLHRPGADRFFGVDQTPGLADFLSGSQDLHEVLRQPEGFENLWVLPAGTVSPNPSELLGSSKMEQLVANLRESADWVVLDSAPLLAVADAATTAHWADGVLVVTHAGASTHEAARKSRVQLANVGARVLGVAVWGLEEATADIHVYGYSRGYSAPPAE